MALVFLFSTLQYVNTENCGQLFLTLDPVWIMEHNFFTTQSRLCRAKAEHRALSLKTQWLLLGIFVQKKFLRPISVLGTKGHLISKGLFAIFT